MKVAVGLSGGVDSSVAAALLVEQGHEVVGLTMKIDSGRYESDSKKHACFGGDEEIDIEKARAVAEKLNIPYRVIDLEKEYESMILNYFRQEYQRGRTPNPCVLCNYGMKFELLPFRAKAEGVEFDAFATGHYVRLEDHRGKKILRRAVNRKKDQSYFLSQLRQEHLENSLFPVGELTKEEVRAIAKRWDLPTADDQESQDFFAGDYKKLFAFKASEPGDFVDAQGQILGQHKGFIHYTIGQRKGLWIAGNKPYYVVKFDKKTNAIVLGADEDLYHTRIIVSNINWILWNELTTQRRLDVQIRSTSKAARATITPLSKFEALVEFDESARAPTPGQAAVFYDGEYLMGGGFIQRLAE